jgi:hypothetical protein
MPIKKPAKQPPKPDPRKQGFELLEKALDLLGWQYALVAEGPEDAPVNGMVIGTDEFILALEKPA